MGRYVLPISEVDCMRLTRFIAANDPGVNIDVNINQQLPQRIAGYSCVCLSCIDLLHGRTNADDLLDPRPTCVPRLHRLCATAQSAWRQRWQHWHDDISWGEDNYDSIRDHRQDDFDPGYNDIKCIWPRGNQVRPMRWNWLYWTNCVCSWNYVSPLPHLATAV